jgi:hypothetical protein
VRDFGFGPVLVERNLPPNPTETAPAYVGTKPPILPKTLALHGGRLASGNVLVVSMTGAGNSAPSLAGGFRLVFDYLKYPSEQDLLEQRVIAEPYCEEKALDILRGVVPPQDWAASITNVN